MASIDSSSLPNGLPIHRVEIPGTRALTVLAAFDAGARMVIVSDVPIVQPAPPIVGPIV